MTCTVQLSHALLYAWRHAWRHAWAEPTCLVANVHACDLTKRKDRCRCEEAWERGLKMSEGGLVNQLLVVGLIGSEYSTLQRNVPLLGFYWCDDFPGIKQETCRRAPLLYSEVIFDPILVIYVQPWTLQGDLHGRWSLCGENAFQSSVLDTLSWLIKAPNAFEMYTYRHEEHEFA